jgi:hypothetical protein
MESLDHRFWEFFAVYTMFLAEREMDPDLAFIEVDIREGSSGRDPSIEPHTELAYHHLSLVLHDPVIQFRKRSREVWVREHSSIFYDELERSTVIHGEILSRIGFNETSTVQRVEFN